MKQKICPLLKNRSVPPIVSSEKYKKTKVSQANMRVIYVQYFVFFQLFVTLHGQTSKFIRDYFVYKRVPRVVGFSCGNKDAMKLGMSLKTTFDVDDFQTVKLLNAAGILTSIKGPQSTYDLKVFLTPSFWTLGVFVDIRCASQNASDIFDKSSGYRMYDLAYNWLVLGKDLSDSVRVLNDTSYSVVTDLIISVPDTDHLNLYDVYNQCKYRGGLLNVTKFGTWRSDTGLNITLLAGKLARRWNFHGMTLNVSGIVQQRPKGMPLIHYLQDENMKMLENWSKFGFSMMQHFADILNFTMHITELNRWEKNDSNGPLMNGLKRGDIDLGYYPAILTKERLDYARVIVQAWPIRTCFMFRSPPSKKIRIRMILGPLATSTWHMIAIFTVVAIFFLTLILRLESRNRNVDDMSDYGVSVLITIAAICQQGVSSFPNLLASRIAFLQITVFGLLVYNYYSAAIVSARLNEPVDKLNDSLFTLVNSGMTLAAERIVFFNFLLRDPRPDVQYFRKHWAGVPEDRKFLPIEDGIRHVTGGGFAYHADPSDAYPYIDRYFDKQMICQLTEIHLLRPSEIGLWSSHNGQFLEVAKIGLMKIASTGLRRRQVIRWSSRKPYCQKDGLLLASVTIYEAAPIVIILACGILLSIIICIIENIFYYTLQTNLREKSLNAKNKPLFIKVFQQTKPTISLSKNKSLLNLSH